MRKTALFVALFLLPSFAFAVDTDIAQITKSDACNMQDNFYNQMLQTQWSRGYNSRAYSFLKIENKIVYPVTVWSKKRYSGTNASVHLFIYSCNSKKVIKNQLIDGATNYSHSLSFNKISNSPLYSIHYGLTEGERSPWGVIDTQKDTVYAFDSSNEYMQQIKSCSQGNYYFCGFTDFSYEKNSLFAKFKSSDINSPERDKEEKYKIDMDKKKIIKQ